MRPTYSAFVKTKHVTEEAARIDAEFDTFNSLDHIGEADLFIRFAIEQSVFEVPAALVLHLLGLGLFHAVQLTVRKSSWSQIALRIGHQSV